jgi:DoxX-like family
MNLALWIATVGLAVVFGGSGAFKLIDPKKLASTGMGFGVNAIRWIGVAEVAAAIGLVLPPLVHIATFFVPLAAVGLVVVMIGAAYLHGRRREFPVAAFTVLLLGVSVFVAWGRFGAYAFGQ